ncbi:unnamed protein product [Caenorhabditis angaria]|uniref:G-protein coupled receptors family 1 profile domain-containing protein n=1 Tax=Caenorhabditis angaria TaxID=860376 RepID=A0A9P1IWT6_9PELO|nr:unnamed protein product [Caenorhabditis angaria]
MITEYLYAVRWPTYIWYGMSIISVPIYLIVVICLVKLRRVQKNYNTTFYTLLLQHSIADLFTMFFYFVLMSLREVQIIRQFYFDYQEYYIAPATYTTTYLFIYIRCFGIILLTFQRFVIITASSSDFAHAIQEASTWKIVLVYWSVPCLVSLVALKHIEIRFDSPIEMNLIIDKSTIMKNTVMGLCVTSFTFFTCTAVYILIAHSIRKKLSSSPNSRSLRRETLVALQIFILLVAFFGVFLYCGFLNYFSMNREEFGYGPVYFMRSIYPVASGMLSYVNPFCILFLNKEFSTQVRRMITCKELVVTKTSTTLSIANRGLTNVATY